MTGNNKRARAPSATDWIAPWMQMCEIACTAPLVVGYRTARMLTGGWPPSGRARREYTRMWRENRSVHAGGGCRGDRAARPGRGRAGSDSGASSGARQRAKAVPRVSRPTRTTPADGFAAEGRRNHEPETPGGQWRELMPGSRHRSAIFDGRDCLGYPNDRRMSFRRSGSRSRRPQAARTRHPIRVHSQSTTSPGL